jgi:hypothetical protein
VREAVRRLRRAAVFDIFDQLGLAIVPGQVWRFAEAADDVADGLEAFFVAIGCDPRRIASHEPQELARLATALELLAEVHTAFERLDEAVRERLADRLFSGDYATVAAAGRAVATFERIYRLQGCWPADRRLGAVNRFLEVVWAGLTDPLSASPREVEEIAAAADTATRLMLDFGAAQARHESLCEGLRRVRDSDWLRGPDADTAHEYLDYFVRLTAELQRDQWGGLGDAARKVLELRTINDRLARILDAAPRGSGEARPRPSRAGDLQQALVFFGFSPTATPDSSEVEAAWKGKVRLIHPDRGPESERAERTRMTGEANLYRDLLRAAFEITRVVA